MDDPKAPLEIGIADDHPIMRTALASSLAELAPGSRFHEAADAAGALALADAHPELDLMVVDLKMPGTRGLETVRELRSRAPQIPLVVVSADDDPAHVEPLLALGVSAFVPKSEPPAVIVSAVRLVLAGGTYAPPRLVAAGAGRMGAVPDTTLTPRQWEVVRLLARGLPNKAIARALGVTEGTVKVHLIAVFRALDVRNRTAAVIAARRYLD
ncbi:MAG: response regulator transcription factor [Burkholderiales bacterium]